MTRTLTLIATATLLFGCAAQPKPAPMSPVPTGQQIESIRAAFQTSHPNAHVGVVAAALGDAPYVLVTQIDSSGVRAGTVVTFLDADQNVVSNGVVVKADATGLTVKYDAKPSKPRVGDAAVTF